ncbi:IclR family transcriptional regulator [Clostridium sp. Cult2]|uniref:IclR family transcriptional regulator n=1 Tax=Clostridium sp. Cult2 TaxID=2079003 RepID=UPI001F2FFBD6|nr:IclR family transcriptional regulator [Clostridium sp. Cult2]MCF6464930.1 IclR family transcriptional regulator [Clostridium sp. Cult2]
MTKDKYLLSSVYNTLEVLDLLSEHKELTLSEISKELNLGKASVFRMLYTLEKKQFVHKTSGAKYKLGIKFAHFGAKVLDRQNNLDIIRPFLGKLRDEHNETVHLSVLDADYNIIVIDKAKSNFAIQMTSRIGGKLPGYCTAMGKTLLANMLDDELKEKIFSFTLEKKTDTTITNPNELIKELEKIREKGYAEDLEECEVGLVCYAAPIRDFDGNTTMAISFSGPSIRMRQNKEKLVHSIKEIAEEISKKIGYIR